jgi:GrpB-like predicted nucleotidyltransferase (UPF0157 family)
MSIGVKKRTVKIVGYNPQWKDEFLKEKIALEYSLKNYDVDIQHIGSTSIVGCKAKPIVDIAIGVSPLMYGKQLIPILQKIGYFYDGKHDGDVRFFLKKCKDDIETYFIHIEDTNSRIWQHHILFRDYMKLHPEEVVKYSDLKENLAQKFCDDRKGYTQAKDVYIEQIIDKAFKYFDVKRKGEDYNCI